MDYAYFLLILTVIYSTAADYIPDGYLGCFDDSGGRHLDIVKKTSNTNTGDECKQRCSEERYRYAGTKAANQCHCGTKLLNNQKGNRCNLECTGSIDEKCGGPMQISIYETLQIAATETAGKDSNNNTTPEDPTTTRVTAVSDSTFRTFAISSKTEHHLTTSQTKQTTTVFAGNESTQKATTLEALTTVRVPISTSSSLSVNDRTTIFSTSQTKQASTSIAENENTHEATIIEASTSVRIPISTQSSVSVRNITVIRTTTSHTQQMSVFSSIVNKYLWYILAAAGFMVLLIVTIVAFFVGRMRGQRSMVIPVSESETTPTFPVYNDLVMIQRSAGLEEDGYLTPCTFKSEEPPNEYDLIV